MAKPRPGRGSVQPRGRPKRRDLVAVLPKGSDRRSRQRQRKRPEVATSAEVAAPCPGSSPRRRHPTRRDDNAGSSATKDLEKVAREPGLRAVSRRLVQGRRPGDPVAGPAPVGLPRRNKDLGRLGLPVGERRVDGRPRNWMSSNTTGRSRWPTELTTATRASPRAEAAAASASCRPIVSAHVPEVIGRELQFVAGSRSASAAAASSRRRCRRGCRAGRYQLGERTSSTLPSSASVRASAAADTVAAELRSPPARPGARITDRERPPRRPRPPARGAARSPIPRAAAGDDRASARQIDPGHGPRRPVEGKAIRRSDR